MDRLCGLGHQEQLWVWLSSKRTQELPCPPGVPPGAFPPRASMWYVIPSVELTSGLCHGCSLCLIRGHPETESSFSSEEVTSTLK